MRALAYYILDADRRVVPARDVIEWGAWFENLANRRVAATHFECGVFVSTIFLGIDHRFDDSGPPLVFETMTFELSMDGGDDFQFRYSSWDDAVAGHAGVVRRVKAQLAKAGLSTSEIEATA